MPRADRSQEGPEQRFGEPFVADFMPVPSEELRLQIVDCLLPDPAVLDLIEQAYGKESDMWGEMRDVLYGQPADLNVDMERFEDFLHYFSHLFADLPPIRPYKTDEQVNYEHKRKFPDTPSND